jgi:hypothetical protein
MSESEFVETEHGASFTLSVQGLSIGQDNQRIELTPRGAWDLLELLDRHRGELLQLVHPESMGTDQQILEFATQYVSTSYDMGSFSIDRCARAPQEEGDSPDEWKVLVSWGNDEFTLAIKMFDELTVIGVEGVEPPESEYARQVEQDQKAVEADTHDIANIKKEWHDYRTAGDETPGAGQI